MPKTKSLTKSRARVSSLVNTFESALAETRQPETPDVCLHFAINWRQLDPESDGRLHATFHFVAHVSRSAFIN